MHRTLAAAAALAAFAGCASTPPATTASTSAASPPPAASTTARAPSASSAASGPASSADASAGALGNNTAAAAPSQRSIFFDYDSNVVKEEYAGVVKSNAQYLSAKRAGKVTIEGNTDERGSREYNLALGQRRADTVKQRLTLLGVPAEAIETVSLGEEKPRVEGETEQAFAQNRRADIVYGR